MSPRPNPHPVFGVTTVGGATAEKECNCIRELMSILGDADGDLCFLLPFFEGTLGAAADVQDVSSRGLHALNVVAVDNVPVIRGDMLSVRMNGTDEHMTIADNVLLTPITGGVDVPFSVGCAFKSDIAPAAIENLIAKWDDTAAVAQEWRLTLTANAYPALEVFDNSVALSNLGREDQTAIVANVWYIVIATYNGAGGDPGAMDGINIYRWDGATHGWDGAVDDANIDGGGAYLNMEDTAELVVIGAKDSGVPAEWFDGEIMMPWYTRRELSAVDARRAALTMVRIMGL